MHIMTYSISQLFVGRPAGGIHIIEMLGTEGMETLFGLTLTATPRVCPHQLYEYNSLECVNCGRVKSGLWNGNKWFIISECSNGGYWFNWHVDSNAPVKDLKIMLKIMCIWMYKHMGTNTTVRLNWPKLGIKQHIVFVKCKWIEFFTYAYFKEIGGFTKCLFWSV